MALKTRKPTGAVPWPCILLEGQEKGGKSWAIAQLSKSEKVGQTYWLDLGEGAGDEYGAIEDARYLIIDHNGSWDDIISQVEDARTEAQRAHDAGEPPVVLGIDTMTAEWEMLSRYAEDRAKLSKSNREKLAKDPNAEIVVGTTYWNAATARHKQLMAKLLTFPGIVVMTAKGKEVAEMGKDGQPVAGKKTYKVEGQKNLGYDATAWVRVYRDKVPELIGARSVHAGLVPGKDDPRPLPGFTLERLVFDLLKCDPRKAHVRDLKQLDGRSGDEQLSDAKNRVWEAAQALGWDVAKLAADFAECHDGAKLTAADATTLDEYMIDLQRALEEQQVEPATKAA